MAEGCRGSSRGWFVLPKLAGRVVCFINTKKAVRVVDVYHVAFAPGRVGRSAAGTRATL
jgi:hypothetical protein